MRQIKIDTNDENQRLDRFLYKYLDQAPKGLVQKYIRKKKIKVNKKRAYPDLILKKGDILNFYIYDEVLDKYISEQNFPILDKSLNYVYDDQNISIIYKPAGYLMYGSEMDNIKDLYISDLIKKGDFDPKKEKSFTPALANRLDRNTEGLVVGCKNASSLREVNRAFKDRDLEKVYRCLVKGRLDEKVVVDKPLIRINNKEVAVSDRGKPALSIFYPIKSSDKYTLIRALLVTGRKHQLRVHLSSISHPIIGDSKYGSADDMEKFNLKGQYLIAEKLNFKKLNPPLSYLNNKSFKIKEENIDKDLEDRILNL